MGLSTCLRVAIIRALDSVISGVSLSASLLAGLLDDLGGDLLLAGILAELGGSLFAVNLDDDIAQWAFWVTTNIDGDTKVTHCCAEVVIGW